ncbi:MAG: OsmC family peroxiredoxin [Thermomicrobiales bacterium]
MAADRSASVTWHGNLSDGSGVITDVTSGAFSNLDVSWPARTEEPGGKTSPEELIAAAHAACFSMGLSHGLSGAGNPPQKLEVTATCTFDPPKISKMHIKVKGQVDGIDQAAFEQAAKDAADGCPVSGALKGNVEISVEAELE